MLTPNIEVTQADVDLVMRLNLKRFGYLNTRQDRMELTAILNTILNQPGFKTQLPRDPLNPDKVKGVTKEITKAEAAELLKE